MFGYEMIKGRVGQPFLFLLVKEVTKLHSVHIMY